MRHRRNIAPANAPLPAHTHGNATSVAPVPSHPPSRPPYREARAPEYLGPQVSPGYPNRMHVLRWGRSAVETDDDLRAEAAAVRGLGATWGQLDHAASPRGATVLLVHSGRPVHDAALGALEAGAWVLTTTSGTDHIDLGSAHRRGIGVARCPLARRDAVVGWSLAALEALLRGQPSLDAAARAGRWARADLPALGPRTLAHCQVAVVGMGVIGTRIAQTLQAMGARVLPVDPHAHGALGLHAALARADALTLHCSLGPQTRLLIGPQELDLLPPHAVIVNTARGDVLDLDAAVDRLDAARLGGIAVDVFAKEPHVEMAALARRGVWATPHAAGFTVDLSARVRAEVVAALRAIASGQPPEHTVVPQRAPETR